MTEQIINYSFIYITAITLISALVVSYDKSISRLPRGSVRRIPEKVFVILSALGGGIGTLLMMMLIRHKTKDHLPLLFKITVCALIWSVIIFSLLSI